MTMREFRALPDSTRQMLIDSLDHPAAEWILRLAFPPGKPPRSWLRVARDTGYRWSPDSARKLAARTVRKLRAPNVRFNHPRTRYNGPK